MREHQNNGKTYLFAAIGSCTELGGRVTRVTTKAEHQGMALARVGDIDTYDDRSKAAITNGTGLAAARGGKPLALVGSQLSNGDAITERLLDGWGITVHEGEQIPGLFDAAYTLSLSASAEGGNGHT